MCSYFPHPEVHSQVSDSVHIAYVYDTPYLLFLLLVLKLACLKVDEYFQMLLFKPA